MLSLSASLGPAERQDIAALELEFRQHPPQLADIWAAMDRVWETLQLDNRAPEPAKLNAFYQHPIWLLNALFTEQDAESLSHRRAIVEWLGATSAQTILDYGGGYGSLARMIAAAFPERSVAVCEPFASDSALQLAREWPNLRYIPAPSGHYDCILLIDVLEHIPDPLPVLIQLAGQLAPGGYLLDGSNFYPLIHCHLPSTFYLRYSFPLFAALLGLRYRGRVAGGHATIYQKMATSAPRWALLRCLAVGMRLLYPSFWAAQKVYRRLRNRPA